MYWTTRSTEPMSIPSSSVLVQTSPLIWQFLILFARGRILDLVSSIPVKWNLDDPNSVDASQKLRDLLRVPDRGGQPYPLKTRGTNLFQPLQANSELNASSITCQFMDLINHD